MLNSFRPTGFFEFADGGAREPDGDNSNIIIYHSHTRQTHTHTHGHTRRDTLNKQIVCRNVSTVLFNLLNKQTNKHHVYQLSKLKQGFAVYSL